MTYYANIKAYWDKHVQPVDIETGLAAYQGYNRMIRKIANHYKVDFIKTVEAFAALSPNSDYKGNLRSLISLLEGMKTNTPWIISTYRACGHRAESYLNGSVDFLSTVKGPKITAFRNCILDPTSCQDFVIDGHMIAIALGKQLTMAQANLELQKIGYKTLNKPYQKFSLVKDTTPSMIQATLWYCRKRTEDIKFSRQKDAWYDDARLIYDLIDLPPYKTKKGQPKQTTTVTTTQLSLF